MVRLKKRMQINQEGKIHKTRKAEESRHIAAQNMYYAWEGRTACWEVY